jgi:hypothetical protein
MTDVYEFGATVTFVTLLKVFVPEKVLVEFFNAAFPSLAAELAAASAELLAATAELAADVALAAAAAAELADCV